MRATANSILTLGVYLGFALSSVSVMLIEKNGWRYLYKIIGVIGIVISLLAFLLVREPKRGRFDETYQEIMIGSVLD